MILVDSAIWIDHFRHQNPTLADLATRRAIVVHPFVIGEVFLGHIRSRMEVLKHMRKLPRLLVAKDAEVWEMIERRQLAGQGIGYVDAHLLAACLIAPGTWLWTLDQRLAAAVDRLGIRAELDRPY